MNMCGHDLTKSCNTPQEKPLPPDNGSFGTRPFLVVVVVASSSFINVITQ